MADGHLRTIKCAIENAQRCLQDKDSCPTVALSKVRQAFDVHSILNDSHAIPAEESGDIRRSLSALETALKSEIEMNRRESSDDFAFSARRIPTGGAGRPKVYLPKEQLQMFVKMGYTAKKMAKHFKCSAQLVYKRLYEEGIHMRDQYKQITDNELDAAVKELNDNHPNTGATMMAGILESKDLKVQRERVRSSLKRVDPESSSQRFGRTVKRRTYRVPYPNSIWHIDGHMKLIRWGIVTHGAIDGYSRLVPYLFSSSNNRAATVLRRFVPACMRYGVPARVRSDHGKENILVGLFMNMINGEESNAILTGRSVHNQRIERLWKDVFEQVIQYYYNLFYQMEDKEILSVGSEKHIFSIQFVFIPLINAQLEVFRNGWNKHKLRTENNRSPEELWLSGILDNLHSPSMAISNMFDAQPLEVSLNEALEHFNIDMQPFESENTEYLSIINDNQQEHLAAIIDVNDDYESKFLACLGSLESMGLFV